MRNPFLVADGGDLVVGRCEIRVQMDTIVISMKRGRSCLLVRSWRGNHDELRGRGEGDEGWGRGPGTVDATRRR